MGLTLVNNASNSKAKFGICSKCGCDKLRVIGLAWSCPVCGNYEPADLGGAAAIERLKENLKSLQDLHGRMKFMRQQLEDLVKE